MTASAIDEVLFEFHGVSREYGEPPTVALAGIDLVVRKGELLAIVGPSGSGKSTLLNLIGTLDRPSTGEMRFEGQTIAQLRDTELSALRAHEIGFVFQQYHLEDGMTALDNVAAGLLYTGITLDERRKRAEHALARVGLANRLGYTPRQLSGGQRQRVAIARAVVGDPKLLLADEPTGALDSKAGAAVMGILHELHAEGTTVIVITHDATLAARFPRRISLFDGQIIEDTSACVNVSTSAVTVPASEPEISK